MPSTTANKELTELDHVAQTVENERVPGDETRRVELGGFIRPTQTFVH